MMASDDIPEPKRAVGLRERKKEKTRLAIQREALRLFQEQGYEATTVEQIAAAVEISPSTFFNYFPSKEDVVVYDPYDPEVLEALAELPAGESLTTTFRLLSNRLDALFQRDRELILIRTRLAMETPELLGRMWEEMERGQVMMQTVIAQRTGRDPDDLEVRVAARLLLGAVWESFLEWSRRDGKVSLKDLINRALDVVDAGAQPDAIKPAQSRG
jgi:AcrR family transcriptional regulator